MTMGQMKKVMIVDDHDVLRRGIGLLVQTLPNLQVVAEAGSGLEAMSLAEEKKPDIAILDYSIPEINGRDLMVKLQRLNPSISVILYTMHNSDELILDALRAGARWIVLKSDPEAHLIDALRAVMAGRPYFSGTVSETFLTRLLPLPSQEEASVLTLREREVVQLIAEGMINKQVAHRLNISTKTIETHRATIMHKLNIRTTAELVRYALRSKIAMA